MLESSVPTRFWVEALATAAHLINHMPSPSIANQSPYYRLYKTSPSYDDLHVFGSICFVHLPPSERTKLTAQSAKCAFLGYAPFQKGFLCYDPNIRRIRTSRNVVFFENKYFFHQNLDPPDPDPDPDPSLVYLPGFFKTNLLFGFILNLCIKDGTKMHLQVLPFLIFLRHRVCLLHCVVPLVLQSYQTAMGSLILP